MTDPAVLTVTELTQRLKSLVETSFPTVCVVGQISNCTRAGSGHVYLTLKDDSAQLRGVIWRSAASRVRFELQDGLEVVATGSLEVYAARGSYQLVIERLIPQGIGALELAFRQLQEKLAREGLFDPERKRPLPRFPRRIALVTSPTGAAVRDLLQVITRRWRGADIVLVPVPVQGAGAAERIAEALGRVPRIPHVDVIVTGRGGGSLEDLWAFNEEAVARAIFACPIPVVSAVGHEIDVTIADLVADRRALTPSEAGELVVPNADEIRDHLDRSADRLALGLTSRVARARTQLEAIASRPVIARPRNRIRDLEQRLDELSDRLSRGMTRRTDAAGRDVARLAGALDALSPLRVLERGYTITRRSASGTVLRSIDDLRLGEALDTLFRTGRVTSRIESIDATNTPASGRRRPAGSSHDTNPHETTDP